MTRLDKAWRLIQREKVKVVGDDNIFTTFYVTSDSDNKKEYYITYDKKEGIWLCECPDYAYRSAKLVMDDDGERIGSFLCSHIMACIMYLMKIKNRGQVVFA